MDILTIIISAIAGIAGGFAIAKFLEKSNVSNLIKNAKKEAGSILKDANLEAENIKKDKILQAKEKFIELKAEHEQVILSRDKRRTLLTEGGHRRDWHAHADLLQFTYEQAKQKTNR